MLIITIISRYLPVHEPRLDRFYVLYPHECRYQGNESHEKLVPTLLIVHLKRLFGFGVVFASRLVLLRAMESTFYKANLLEKSSRQFSKKKVTIKIDKMNRDEQNDNRWCDNYAINCLPLIDDGFVWADRRSKVDLVDDVSKGWWT